MAPGVPESSGDAAAPGPQRRASGMNMKGLATLLGGGGGKEAEGGECDVPACRTMVDVLRKATAAAAGAAAAGGPKAAAAGAAADTAAKDEAEVEGTPAWRSRHCPLGREALGDATWGFLHSTAAYYPERPTAEQQGLAAALIRSVAEFYPCSYCRKDFKESTQVDPPKVESRAAFSTWLCRQHNLVNQKLGKPTFNCDLANLDRRWRTGDVKCWSADAIEAPEPEEAASNGQAAAGGGGGAAAAPAAAAGGGGGGGAAGTAAKKKTIYIIEPDAHKKN